MSSQSAGPSSERARGETVVQYLLIALFGSLIVVAFGYEAVEAASRFGWIAYPLVLGSGLASFVFVQYAWGVVSDSMAAELRRQRLEEQTGCTDGDVIAGDTQ